MTHHDLTGVPHVRVHLRRSSRARRMSLRVSRLDGRVTLTLPPHVPAREGAAFAEDRAEWIRGHLADIGAQEPVALGSVVPVLGMPFTVVAGPRTALALATQEIAVPEPGSAGPAVGGLLKMLARERLSAASDAYAARLGQGYTRFTLRDTRSRWGSCTEAGGLMYSWRLVMAPPDVLDYVAAHEVAHLREMNHSARYWAVLRGLCPGFEAPRRWLRTHGQDLHRYRFDTGAAAD